MKKSFVLAAMAGIIAMSFAFLPPDKPRYENLKVLPKDTDKHQMDSIMKHFSASLGVKCNFCHVTTETDGKRNINFVSDDNKHKNIARTMFKMMVKINKKYFREDDDDHKGLSGTPTVTCYSCHHGEKHPKNIPPVPAATGQKS